MRLPLLNPADQASFDKEQLKRMVDTFIERGFTYFDTAWMYHNFQSEEVLKEVLVERYPRESYTITSKLPIMMIYTEEKQRETFQRQLQKVGVDYFDYYLVHSLNENTYKNAVKLKSFEYLQQLKAEGKIKHMGISFHDNAELLDRILTEHPEIELVQIQLNYVDWHNGNNQNPLNPDGEYLYNELAKRGIPAVIMEPLLGGRLAKVPDHVVAHLKQRRPDNSVASWAFRYAGSMPNVLCVLSGMTYMEHLEDNLRTYCPLEPLEEEDVKWLEGETASLIISYPTIACNDCKYCMPCPYGLDIPAIFVHYNKCVNKGNVPESQQAENYQKARRAFLIGYDRSVPKLRQADHCIGCRQCVAHCPQNINIPREMQRIDRFVEALKQGTL